MKIALFLLATALVNAKSWNAGLGSADISPTEPIYLNGYGNRTHPSTGVKQKLWAKAVALEDEKGNRVVIVTTDLLGLPGSVSDVIAARLAKQYGMKRSQLLLNSSHTHGAPMVEGNLATMFMLNTTERLAIHNYTERLKDQIVAAVQQAVADLKPAQLATGHGKASFAVNRRVAAANGVYTIGVNPTGPIDHDVPVLRISSPDGKLRAALFGYTCHNTTMGGDISKPTPTTPVTRKRLLKSSTPARKPCSIFFAAATKTPALAASLSSPKSMATPWPAQLLR